MEFVSRSPCVEKQVSVDNVVSSSSSSVYNSFVVEPLVASFVLNSQSEDTLTGVVSPLPCVAPIALDAAAPAASSIWSRVNCVPTEPRSP